MHVGNDKGRENGEFMTSFGQADKQELKVNKHQSGMTVEAIST